MRDHELDLIAALVEGRLDDESEARALIESSPEYREEYEAQKMAYEALRGVGSASLSEQESSALRRDVWTDLKTEPVSSTARSVWFYRWASVAAGLFVVVGLVAVLGQDGATDDSSRGTMGLAEAPLDASTSTAADEIQEDSDGGAAPAGGEAQTDNTTTAEDGGDSGFQSGGDGSEEAEAPQYAEEAEMVRQGDLSGGDLESVEGSETRTAEAAQCLETLGIGDYEIVATLPDSPTAASPDTTGTTTDGTTTTSAEEQAALLVAVPDVDETAVAPVAFVDVESCELVYLDQ